MPKHSIISWDCSFRNFFHLISSLENQDYDLSNVEFIFIEQRSQSVADEICRTVATLPINEVVRRYTKKLQVQICYLEEADSEPYHPGRLLNRGIELAKGAYISTMDADILVPNNFFKVLDMVHARGDVVVCMHRYTAAYPCGVLFENWTNQIIITISS